MGIASKIRPSAGPKRKSQVGAEGKRISAMKRTSMAAWDAGAHTEEEDEDDEDDPVEEFRLLAEFMFQFNTVLTSNIVT